MSQSTGLRNRSINIYFETFLLYFSYYFESMDVGALVRMKEKNLKTAEYIKRKLTRKI